MNYQPARKTLITLGIAAGLASAAHAAIITSSPAWPPAVSPTGDIGYILSGLPPSFTGGGVTIVMDSALLRMVAPVTTVPAGPDEQASFSANMDSVSDVIPLATDLASSSSGNGSIITLGKTGNTTGTFATELISLNLSGATALGPFLFRESPTLASSGQTTITDLGGGQYRIDSFFDVFTELSLDNGANWIPNASGAARFTLIPEPGTALCAALAGGILCLRRRRD